MCAMLAVEREKREEEIFAAAPLFYRWRVGGYLDLDDVYNSEELEYFRLNDITPMPIERRQTPLEFYGIECGDGWLPIILEASVRIEPMLRELLSAGVPLDHLPGVAQIKEKFGEMRFSVRCFSPGGTPTDVREVIQWALDRAKQVCEG